MHLKYTGAIIAHEGRLLEAIPKMELGVASRGAGSPPSLREAPGPRPPGTTTRMRGARCDRSGCSPKRKLRRAAGEGSAGPEPKIATVERREASVSERRKGTPHGCPSTRALSRRSATPHSGARSLKMQNPGAKTRRGNEETCAV